jgi:hypothetical protein
MRRISSKMTFYYKRIFPIFWFGFLAIFVVTSSATSWRAGQFPAFELILVPLIMLGFGFILMRKLVFDLMDEVFDEGDVLLIRNGSQEERVLLSDIINVNYSPLTSPPRVTLSLRTPSVFGTQITFCAPARFIPFAASPVVDELIRRIDDRRQVRR